MINDQQGNARFSFSDNGTALTIRQENSYYAFGEQLAGSPVTPLPTTPNINLYNGGSEWQAFTSNLPDYNQTLNRNYDPAIGRFIAVDPSPESADGMNVYQYAGNNPISNNDPLGNVSAHGNEYGQNHATVGFINHATEFDEMDAELDQEAADWNNFGGLGDAGAPILGAQDISDQYIGTGPVIGVITIGPATIGSADDGQPDLFAQRTANRLVQQTSPGYFSTLWNDMSNYDFGTSVTSKWNDWTDDPMNLWNDISDATGSLLYDASSLVHGEGWKQMYDSEVNYWNSSPEERANNDAGVLQNTLTNVGAFGPIADFTPGTITTPDGFLLGSVKVTTPIDLSVNLYASDYSQSMNSFRYSTFAPDALGNTNWFGRYMLQITPDFQSTLGPWTRATIPAGTIRNVGLVGPQAGMPFGTWLQMFVPQGTPLH